MPIRYAVGKQKVVRHGNLEGAKPVIVWIPDEYFGLHDTAIAAKRAFVVAMFPYSVDHSDKQIAHYFDRQARSSMPQAKVVKVPHLQA